MPSRASAAASPQPTVRVQLTRFRTNSLTVSASSGLLSITANSVQMTAPSLDLLAAGSQVVLKDTSGAQRALGEMVGITAPDAIVVKCPGGTSATYKGILEVHAAAGKLALVNEVGLEDYVAGVVPAEMPNSYPLDALKAQAVVARTYVLRNKNKHSSAGCDVCDSSHCQTYSGVISGRDRCRAAVAETAGLILTYRGEPAHVFYSADAGGCTQDYAAAYPRVDAPYLCGVKDPDGVPHTTWERAYSLAELAERLLRAGIKEASGLQSVLTTQVVSTSRVLTVGITGSQGSTSVTAARLRDILGLDQLLSCLFVIEPDDQGRVVFKGKGYGHGIGLCQLGAKGLAQQPFNYSWDRILAHYFPGTEVKTPTGVRIAAAAPVKTNQPPRVSKSKPGNVPAPTLRLNPRLIDPEFLEICP